MKSYYAILRAILIYIVFFLTSLCNAQLDISGKSKQLIGNWYLAEIYNYKTTTTFDSLTTSDKISFTPLLFTRIRKHPNDISIRKGAWHLVEMIDLVIVNGKNAVKKTGKLGLELIYDDEMGATRTNSIKTIEPDKLIFEEVSGDHGFIMTFKKIAIKGL